jgi:ribosomal RNA methyltransferase Nop2
MFNDQSDSGDDNQQQTLSLSKKARKRLARFEDGDTSDADAPTAADEAISDEEFSDGANDDDEFDAELLEDDDSELGGDASQLFSEDDDNASMDGMDDSDDASFIENDDEFPMGSGSDEDDQESFSETEQTEQSGRAGMTDDEDGIQTNIAETDTFVLPSGQEVEKDRNVAPDIAIVNQRIQDIIRVLGSFKELKDQNK